MAWHGMNANRAHDLTMWKPCQGKRNRGRPETRWTEEIHKHLSKITNWAEMAKWLNMEEAFVLR